LRRADHENRGKKPPGKRGKVKKCRPRKNEGKDPSTRAKGSGRGPKLNLSIILNREKSVSGESGLGESEKKSKIKKKT